MRKFEYVCTLRVFWRMRIQKRLSVTYQRLPSSTCHGYSRLMKMTIRNMKSMITFAMAIFQLSLYFSLAKV